MIRATKVFPADAWSHVATDTVVLDFDHRHRRRLRMQGEGGLDFLLDLPEAVAIRDGDGLLLEDGRIVAVKASDEPLLAVRARDARHLARLAWHLGNHHVPVQFAADRLLLRDDPAAAAMLAELGATLAPVAAPFEPEGGAAADHEHG
ncbi:MAG: urease accessory protein UreE [Rhizobiales bacterium]|nr:urease accessory protein UreE [Hyphomicrobiales bacterium]